MPKKIKNERAVRALCKAGQKIAAIKLLRDSNRPAMGLFDSKEWVEREYPALRPPEPVAQPSVKSAEQIEQEIKDTEASYNHVLTGSLATIQINAPRALMQIEATTKLRALHWVLGREYKSRFKGKLNS